eukprot:TRINITY_DN749_c0_g1_i12.p2 TRINITY_DN749_c0_g1~~TRINITY_DN749_c0_g1_i12.p2  ORF type:complete len:158 (+),score=36.91 TRINITY_DN749_c0_g1_i12:157-630(+)
MFKVAVFVLAVFAAVSNGFISDVLSVRDGLPTVNQIATNVLNASPSGVSASTLTSGALPAAPVVPPTSPTVSPSPTPTVPATPSVSPSPSKEVVTVSPTPVTVVELVPVSLVVSSPTTTLVITDDAATETADISEEPMPEAEDEAPEIETITLTITQ